MEHSTFVSSTNQNWIGMNINDFHQPSENPFKASIYSHYLESLLIDQLLFRHNRFSMFIVSFGPDGLN